MSNLLNIGHLNGPILVFGGVYSNVQALEAMKVTGDSLGIPASNIICTGDVVGYCADPEASVQLMKSWGIHTIAGNVELNLRDESDDCGCNFNEGSRCDVFSRMWYPFAQRQLSKDSIGWIHELPDHLRFSYAGKAIHVLHGSASNVSEFVFQSTPWEQKQHAFEVTAAEVILAGHSGIPFSDEQNQRTWLNAGVIGMPANDGTPRVWYLLLDDSSDKFQWEFQELEYDYHTANLAMKNNPLPQTYAETLLTGIWDNCEILPESETRQQGIPLRFPSTISTLHS